MIWSELGDRQLIISEIGMLCYAFSELKRERKKKEEEKSQIGGGGGVLSFSQCDLWSVWEEQW